MSEINYFLSTPNKVNGLVLKGPVPYKPVEVPVCGECDGLDCDKCSYSKPEEECDDRKAQMQREDEHNYKLNPLRS